MATLFEGSILSIDPEKDYSTDLIGEGKKYATLKDAARALVEKDVFIDTLKTEKKELNEDLSKRMTMEEALLKLKETDLRNTQVEATMVAATGSDQAVQINTETINRLIQDTVRSQITGATQEAKAEQNVNLVKQQLMSVWGNDFASTLKQKAEELGVTEDWVTQAARTTPQVLLKLVVGNESAKDTSLFSASGVGVSSAALSTNKTSVPQEGKYSYWQKMRTEDPAAYHTPAMSMQRHQAAIRHGEAFFDK
jgi:hypothetical protein